MAYNGSTYSCMRSGLNCKYAVMTCRILVARHCPWFLGGKRVRQLAGLVAAIGFLLVAQRSQISLNPFLKFVNDSGPQIGAVLGGVIGPKSRLTVITNQRQFDF